MRHRLLFALGLMVLLCLPAGVALADAGPHGNYTATTDACAGCHRAHTAPAGQLLLDDTPALCYTCHGTGATGADTNVTDGLYTPLNRSLRAGGFTNVYMDADLTGPQTLAVTSAHEDSGGLSTVWGYGAINAVADPGVGNVPLTCTGCHNPHGGAGSGGVATYRILKGNNAGNTPLFSDGGATTEYASVDVPDESSKQYYTNANGTYAHDHGSYVGSQSIYATLTAWCGQCHTRHKPLNLTATPSGSGHTDSGDAIFAFRHATNVEDDLDCDSCHSSAHGNFMPPYPACITCHVAHGTGVRMGGYSDNVAWPDGTTTPGSDARSALLRLDNRGVCQDCHNK